MNFDISQIKYRWVIVGLGWLIFVLVAGFLFVFDYRPDYFFGLNFFGLLMLTIGITNPALLVNMLLFILIYKDQAMESRLVNAVFKAEIVTTLIFYVSIVIGYIFNLEATAGMIIIMVTQLLLGGYFAYRIYKSEKYGIERKH